MKSQLLTQVLLSYTCYNESLECESAMTARCSVVSLKLDSHIEKVVYMRCAGVKLMRFHRSFIISLGAIFKLLFKLIRLIISIK